MHCYSKENIMKAWMTAAIAATATMTLLAAGAAQANDVSWTITVGSPRPAPRVIYAPPPVIYQPPPVAYYPVYQPAPVVVQPVVYAQPGYHIPPGHSKKWHKKAYKYGYGDGYGRGHGHGHGHGRHHD